MGFIDITVEGAISLRLPYTYELVELDPEVSFEVPANLTQTNSVVPVRLHALDTGIGFRLADLDDFQTILRTGSLDASICVPLGLANLALLFASLYLFHRRVP